MSGCEVNPYCTCDPCHCERPCTCGLAPTGIAVEESWDDARQELTYTVTRRFRPHPSMSRGHAGDRPAVPAGRAAHGPAAEPVGDPAGPLAASLDEDGRRRTVLSHRDRAATGPTTGPGHPAGAEHASVRSTVHRGHTIEVQTRYRILVDGEPLEAHVGVSDTGAVHYHGLPNYSADSALDVVRAVVDSFPDDYPPVDHPPEDTDATGGHR